MDTLKNTDVDHNKLLALLRSGDRKAMELLYDHYAPQVYGLAFIITKNETASEKILKETFFYAWKHHSTYHSANQDFRLWLLGIARKIAREQSSFADFVKNHVDANSVSKTGMNPQMMESKMSGIQKKVFDLVFFGGAKICDVAKHLSVEESNAKQLLREAVSQYRKELEQA